VDRSNRSSFQVPAHVGLLPIFQIHCVNDSLSVWRPLQAAKAKVVLIFEDFSCLPTVRPHHPDFAIAMAAIVCAKGDEGAIRRNGIWVGLVAKLLWRPAQNGDDPNGLAGGCFMMPVAPESRQLLRDLEGDSGALASEARAFLLPIAEDSADRVSFHIVTGRLFRPLNPNVGAHSGRAPLSFMFGKRCTRFRSAICPSNRASWPPMQA
jgi:hypothetical protein